MANTHLDSLLRHLRRIVRPPGGYDTDARLLERYLRQRDEAAFTALVSRHGPMVLGICQRVLDNEHDAEDAFQAVFLVLVRKAASIRRRHSLGAWLYGVAYRTALEARGSMAKRRAKEAKVVPRTEPSVEASNDVREVLDRELSALPQHYRAALILCDLRGKGRKEAALELGCAEGTVASRLARGRALLAKRLARFGLTTAAVTAMVSREAASASVSGALASSTVKAALHFMGLGAAGVVSANVSSLVERVVRIMVVAKLRTMTTLVLLVGMTGLGTSWLYYHRAAAEQTKLPKGVPAQVGNEDQSEQVKLRQELKLLKQDLRGALERVEALEAKLKDRQEIRPEVLYRGRPAAYWIKALQDRDPKYRREAVAALASIGKVDRAVVPVLAGAMKDDDHEVARDAALKLGDIGKAAVPYVNDALKGGDQRVRRLAIVAICFSLKGNGATLVPALREIMKDSKGAERREAIESLAFIGSGAKAAVPDLIELLKGPDEEDRAVAAFALGGIGRGSKAAVPVLIGFLKQSNDVMRYAATVALGKIGPDAREAVPALIPLLKRKQGNDCWNAAIALGRIGPDAKSAIPALLDVLRDPGAGVGQLPDRVREAIQQIDPETAARIK